MAEIVDCFRVTSEKKPNLSKMCCIGDGREVFDLDASLNLQCTLDEARVDPENEMAVLALREYDRRMKEKEAKS